MKSKKAIPSKGKKKGKKMGRPVGAKDKAPRNKSTEGMVMGQIFIDLDTSENPFIKAIRENMDRGAGKPRAFATPKAMLDAMESYVKWAKMNPIISSQLANGLLVKVPLRRPITLTGFSLYCGVSESFWRSFRSTVKDEPGFVSVIKIVEETIADNLFEGAAVGQFNANLISKKLGLAENINMQHGIQADQVAALFPFKRPDESETKQLN